MAYAQRFANARDRNIRYRFNANRISHWIIFYNNYNTQSS